jgi:Cof subfamily protein (haloacid dehalogenase superfamily)
LGKEKPVSYKLLALDLDGTTLGPGLEIQPAVAAAVAAAQARGIYVTLATGRMFGATLPYARHLNISTPVICYQGAAIRDPVSGELYMHVGMPGDLAAEAIEMLLADGIFVIAYIDERLWVAEHRPELDLYLQWHPEGAEVVVARDLAAVVGSSLERLLAQGEAVATPELAARAGNHPPTKLLFLADSPIVEREVARLAAHFDGRLSVVRSHVIFGELTAPGISKGAALEMLAARLGVPREQVVAIGDQANDLPMIEWAGLGLAMGNAIPEVRAAADAVIPPVEEAGVAWAIEHYLLKG